MASDDTLEWVDPNLASLADWALQRWSAFPVDAEPRPLVLVEAMARIEGGGFRSVMGKSAFLRGDVEASTEIPDSVLRIIRDSGNPEGHVGGPREPLVITTASRGQVAFRTDRGPADFPAWKLEGPEIVGVLWVIDPEIANRAWRPMRSVGQPPPIPGSPFRSFGAWLETDGRRLHFLFSGSPEEYTQYPAAQVKESRRAVAVIPIGHDVGPTGPRRAIGVQREVVARLQDLLGARVLINLDASPVAVKARQP